MSQIDELYNNLTDEEIAKYSANAEIEEHIIVGEDRYIKVPDSLKRLAVESDHDVETVTFDCPRFWDEHDMSEMLIYINYMRADGYKDSYRARNVTIDEEDERIMHFTWTISRNVTAIKGDLAFAICIKKTDLNSHEKTHWNSEICKDCYVSEGLECTETAMSEYPDVVTDILLMMSRAYWEQTTMLSVFSYDLLEDLLTDTEDRYVAKTIYRLQFLADFPDYDILGDDEYFGVPNCDGDKLLVLNYSGKMFTYNKDDGFEKVQFIVDDGSITPEKLDREYAMLEPYTSMAGSQFHHYLVTNSTNDLDPNRPYKTIFAFASRGDGVLSTVEAGRCIGVFVDSTMFRLCNLRTNKRFEVTFNDDEIVSINPVEDESWELVNGSVTPDKLDREYWQCTYRISVNGYADLDDIFNDIYVDSTMYYIQFTGLSPIKQIVGDGIFVGYVAVEHDAMTLFNKVNGDIWIYKKNTETITKKEQGGMTEITDGSVTPEKLDREYWEKKVTDVNSWSVLDTLIVQSGEEYIHKITYNPDPDMYAAGPITAGTNLIGFANDGDTMQLLNTDTGDIWMYTLGGNALVKKSNEDVVFAGSFNTMEELQSYAFEENKVYQFSTHAALTMYMDGGRCIGTCLFNEEWSEDIQDDVLVRYLQFVNYTTGSCYLVNLNTGVVTKTSSVEDGIDGKSAYEIAVDNGFDGSETEWLASLKGERGPSGVYTGSGDMPDDCYIQVDPDGDVIDLSEWGERITALENTLDGLETLLSTI